MGNRFSSKKDYNRVLARQPRTSIMIPSFNPPKNLQRKLDSKSLIIPAPVRLSRSTKHDEDAGETVSRKPSSVNEPVQAALPLTREDVSSSPVESTNPSFVSGKPLEPKSEEQQTISQNTSRSTPPKRNSPLNQQTMNGDAVIISRSIIESEKKQGTRDYLPAPFQSSTSIIEHHGKQFVTELRKRTERRYVQYYDEETHQMRFFEVIDSIPYRVIQPLNQNIQSRSQSASVFPPKSKKHAIHPSVSFDQLDQPTISSHASQDWSNRQPRFSSDLDYRYQQRPSSQPPSRRPPPIPNNQFHSRTAYSRKSRNQLSTDTSSDSPSSRDTTYGEYVPRGVSSHYNGIDEVIYDRASPIRQNFSSRSPAPSQSATPSSSSRSTLKNPAKFQSKPYNGYNRYPSNSVPFRIHTPTISNGSTSSTTRDSYESDEQTDSSDQGIGDETGQMDEPLDDYYGTNSAVSHGRTSAYHSSTPFDLFPRSLNANGHYPYRNRPTLQSYDEPVKNRIMSRPSHADYAPIPHAIKQPNYN